MDKDESIDRLLRRTAAARDGTRLVESCLDVETLAAWTDGSLTVAERAAAEAHAADCDRCLSVLAAIARTTPPLPDTHRASWFRLRWLVPLSTAAVAITAWIVIQEPQPRSATDGTQATGETQQKHGESEAESREPRQAKPSARATEETQGKHRSSEVDATARPQETLAKKEASPPALSRDVGAANRVRSAEDKAAPRLEELRQLPGRVAGKPAAPAPPAARAAAAAEPRNELADERQGLRAAQVAAVVIPSPDPNVRWRLVGTTVERSADNGRTWTAQPTNTAVELRAGSAPAADVCWIVGRSGVVLLSTDGRTWRRLEFPDQGADLIAVAAVDSAAATVTAADGRTYRTTDGGRTWTLQETPAAPF